MNIRLAQEKDLLSLTALFDAYRVFYEKKSDIPGAKQFLKERLKKRDAQLFLAEENNLVLGFTQLYPIFSSTKMKKLWLLNDLFVAPEARGRGISKALIEAAKDLARASNACGLLLETAKDNSIGNALYPTCGFKQNETANFYEWTDDQ